MDIQDGVERQTRPATERPSAPTVELLALAMLDEFASADDCAELLRLVLMRAVVETESDRGVISWIDGSDMVVGHCYDPFGELVPAGSRWPLAGDEVSRVASAAGWESAEAPEDRSKHLGAALCETYSRLRHLAVVPVAVAGDDIALICVSRRRSEEYREADRKVLDLVARASAQALLAARLREQLLESLAELAEHTQRAEEVERVKTDVLRLASHELRTPLTVLHGYLSMVNDGFFGRIPEQLSAVMAILQRRTGDMNELVNDMLVAARVDEADLRISRIAGDLRLVVAEAVESVAPRASAAHTLLVAVPDDPVMVSMDAARVTMAVRNILDNAVKYSPRGGEVACQLIIRERNAVVRVRDQGLGINPRDRAKIFTRFGRILTTDNSHIPGIGLGLYFTREVARRHGGDVSLAGDSREGAVFELTLPLVGG